MDKRKIKNHIYSNQNEKCYFQMKWRIKENQKLLSYIYRVKNKIDQIKNLTLNKFKIFFST